MKYKGGRFRRSGEGGLEGGRVGEFKGVGGGGGGGGVAGVGEGVARVRGRERVMKKIRVDEERA